MAGISTHVLDAASGEPARGIRVELYREGTLLVSHNTNDDGRIADLTGGPLVPGTYRLVFLLGPQDSPKSSLRTPPFFRRVEVEFAVGAEPRHYHIPLLVSPYAASTYRGS